MPLSRDELLSRAQQAFEKSVTMQAGVEFQQAYAKIATTLSILADVAPLVIDSSQPPLVKANFDAALECLHNVHRMSLERQLVRITQATEYAQLALSASDDCP